MIGGALSAALGTRVELGDRLSAPHPHHSTWEAEADGIGAIVVKLRDQGDRALEKATWTERTLPRLEARGVRVPELVWHGLLDRQTHAMVHRRLPGRTLAARGEARLAELIALVELEADAGPDAAGPPYGDYLANVLFDGWDGVWTRAEAAAPATCARLRRWLEPVAGHRWASRDFAHHDLNLENVLADESGIVGVVDWDEFGLDTRAIDLVGLAFDVRRRGLGDAGEAVERAREVAGEATFRCLVGYAAIGRLAAPGAQRESSVAANWAEVADGLLSELGPR